MPMPLAGGRPKQELDRDSECIYPMFTMTTGDLIQTGILLAATVAVLLSAWQTRSHNRLLKAQLVRDRFEMYWQTYQPVTEEQVDGLKLYPEDYMKLDRYQASYAGDDAAIRKYIYMSALYEYLAFAHTLHHVLKVPDPVGPGWVTRWAEDLAGSAQFQDVHDEYRGYYPKFEAFVDGIFTRNPSLRKSIWSPANTASEPIAPKPSKSRSGPAPHR
ncbi:MAG: hypothetical protein LAN70_18005 [Acidobacteriia bacterium]|nr:hypothetical protein [Terriglobia bacterium]